MNSRSKMNASALLYCSLCLFLFSGNQAYCQPAGKDDKNSEINLQNAEVGLAANAFSKITKQSYIVSDQANRRITVVVPAGKTPEQVAQIFSAALAESGYYLIPLGENLWKISPDNSGFFAPRPPPQLAKGTPQISTRHPDFSGISVSNGTDIKLTAKAVATITSAFLTNSMSLSGSALLYIPAADGSQNGGAYKVVTHQPDSLHEKLGFTNGDIVKAVAGKQMNDPKVVGERAILGLMSVLGSDGHAEVLIERDGAPMTLKFSAPTTAMDPSGYGIKPSHAELDTRRSFPIPTAVPLSGKIVLEKKALETSLVNPQQMLEGIRAVPYFKNGQIAGLRVFAITSGSIGEKMGFKNGDVIRSIDGQPTIASDSLIEAFKKLKNKKSIKLELDRFMQPVTLDIQIK